MGQTMEKIAYKHTEAAEALGISPRTLQRWNKAGIVKSTVILKCRMYAAIDLRKLVEHPPKEEGK